MTTIAQDLDKKQLKKIIRIIPKVEEIKFKIIEFQDESYFSKRKDQYEDVINSLNLTIEKISTMATNLRNP